MVIFKYICFKKLLLIFAVEFETFIFLLVNNEIKVHYSN